MRYDPYIKSLVGKIFKLLPMREQTSDGVELYFDVYISDLADELSGAFITFPELYDSPDYVSVVNCIGYLRDHWEDISFDSFRSKVLRMTNDVASLIVEVD